MKTKIPIYNPQNIEYEAKEVVISPTDNNIKLQVAFEWQKIYGKEKMYENIQN